MTELSGRVDLVENNIAFLVQDLLSRPTIQTISDFRAVWNQQFDLFENKLEDTVRDLNVLQLLYSNLYGYVISGSFSGTFSGNYIGESFETISKNLKQYPSRLYYDSDNTLTGTRYSIGGSNYITKNFTYTSGLLTKIELSGQPTPTTSLNKNFHYSGETLTGVTYN